MTPEEVIQAYRQQQRQRIRWFAIALGTGLLAALAAQLADVAYPAWRIGLIAFSLAFWPWFLVHVYRQGHVGTREALRARRDLGPRP